MEKCKFCGAEVPDGSNFCAECGKPIPRGNVCPHCGAPINDGDVFCQECGKRIDENLSSAEPIQGQCPQCGADVSDGDAFCQNCGHRLIPDEESSDSTSCEDGNEETIGEVVNGSKSKIILPIVVGIIALALVGGWYFLGMSSDTTNSTDVKDSISTDMAAVDTDTLGINEDIGDVHSEAYIKHRLQQICDEIPSTPAEVLVNKYFAESFKELYNAVIKEDQIETQRGNGFFDCDFWTGGRHGELKSVTILDLTNITELSALATVQDLIMFNEDNESKNSKDVHLVFEDGDWYINDLSDYSGSRMSKRMQEYLDDVEIKSQEELAQLNTAIGAFTVKGDDVDSSQEPLIDYDDVEEKPVFPDGDIRDWIQDRLEYPTYLIEDGIGAKVIISFIIDCEGFVRNLKIEGVDTSAHRSYFSEVEKIMQHMSQWKPGKEGKVPVRVKKTIIVYFRHGIITVS